jgi:hypothetical protein
VQSFQDWRKDLATIVKTPNLSGHPKPAISGHLKTGH